jgi:hypothetical protein
MAPLSIEINGYQHTAENNIKGFKLGEDIAILLKDTSESKAIIARKQGEDSSIKILSVISMEKNNEQVVSKEIEYRTKSGETKVVTATFSNRSNL